MYAAQYSERVDAIVLINSSPKKFEEKDLEKHFKTREVAITQGIKALAEYKLRALDEARDLLKDKRHQISLGRSLQRLLLTDLWLLLWRFTLSRKMWWRNCNLQTARYSPLWVATMTCLWATKRNKGGDAEMELMVLEGSDHWVVIEKPGGMYDLLKEFLDKIRGGR
jgi:pimeloyl-ACP methyl ester carboxylesterase